MRKRQALLDAIGICGINFGGLAEPAAAFRIFAGEQVALASVCSHDLAGTGYFEPFGHGFFRFNPFGASHKAFVFV